jgi:hypothetical protein
LDPHLLEQVPALLGRQRLDEVLIKWQWISVGPRPMNSCSKRLIPSPMAASISPCVFIVTSNLPRVPVGSGTAEMFTRPIARPSDLSNLQSTKSTTGQEIYLLFTNRATIGAPMQ